MKRILHESKLILSHRIDLDIESGSSTGYIALVNRIRSYTDKADKTYYVTAAPQCPIPDILEDVFSGVAFDAIYVQFCEEFFITMNPGVLKIFR